jgi:hypothetical protein
MLGDGAGGYVYMDVGLYELGPLSPSAMRTAAWLSAFPYSRRIGLLPVASMDRSPRRNHIDPPIRYN